MLPLYFILSLLFTLGLFFLRKTALQNILLFLFNILQWALSIYEYLHLIIHQLGYFTADAAAVLMLFILSILSTTSSFHSVEYLKQLRKSKDTSLRSESIYYAALCILISAQTGAFLADHIAVT